MTTHGSQQISASQPQGMGTRIFGVMQKLGKALMLPVSVLPVAGILLGVDELSVSIPAIPAVKAQIRTLTLAKCQALAATALLQDSAASVRALVAVDEI